MRTVMSEATEELERRAIELYTDLNEVQGHPRGHRQGVSRQGPGPPHHRSAAAQGHHRRVQGTARHSEPDERQYPMLITTTHKIRAVLAVAAATIVATVGLGYGQAHVAPGCTASGLSSALGQVASSTGAWLSAHPRGRGGGQHGRRERHPHLLRHPPG
jgi:hypothetical protein